MAIPFAYYPPFSGWGRRTNATPAPYYRNVLLRHDGTISAMPFDTERLGMWRFDGQVYYQGRLYHENSKTTWPHKES